MKQSIKKYPHAKIWLITNVKKFNSRRKKISNKRISFRNFRSSIKINHELLCRRMMGENHCWEYFTWNESFWMNYKHLSALHCLVSHLNTFSFMSNYSEMVENWKKNKKKKRIFWEENSHCYKISIISTHNIERSHCKSTLT